MFNYIINEYIQLFMQSFQWPCHELLQVEIVLYGVRESYYKILLLPVICVYGVEM